MVLKRREFITGCGTLAGVGVLSVGGAAQSPSSSHFLLSAEGSGRATGYAEANKVITWGGKTHVVWLDSPDGGFVVRGRTRDNSSGVWSPVQDIGAGYDNHGGPALTVDSNGYLHIAYYPHHHAMRYRRSLRPNDLSAWTEPAEIGERLTYPTLVCGGDDTLYLSCRQSNADAPWTANLYVKPAGGDWEGPRILLRSEMLGYAHFMDALAWGPDGKTLHLACRIYDGEPRRGHTIGYMRSKDYGHTWTRGNGTPVTLPSTAETVDIIAQERDGTGVGLRAAGIAVAPDGRPFVLCGSYDTLPFESWLAYPDAAGAWKKRMLRPELPASLADWGLLTPGGLTFNEDGQLYVVITRIKAGSLIEESIWGHPSSEVVALVSKDLGRTFDTHLLTETELGQPRWLPNIERATGHNDITGSPSVIYTDGGRGANNRELLSNNVYWAKLPA